MTRCDTCQHIGKPGIRNAYCAARKDLPRAYGTNHPLHQLPADKGKSCTEYVENPALRLGEVMRPRR